MAVEKGAKDEHQTLVRPFERIAGRSNLKILEDEEDGKVSMSVSGWWMGEWVDGWVVESSLEEKIVSNRDNRPDVKYK